MKATLSLAVKLFFLIVFVFLAIRVLEYAVVCSRGTIDFSLQLFFERSVNLDTFFIYLWSSAFLLISLFIAVFYKYAAEKTLQFSALTLITIHLLLTGYFLLSNNVLNSSLFEFSGEELLHIIGNEVSVQSVSLLLSIAMIIWLSYNLIYKTSSRINFSKKVQYTLWVIYLLLGVFVSANLRYVSKSIQYFDSNYEYLIGNSKETLFIQSFENEAIKFNPTNIASQTEAFKRYHPEFSFSDEAYPLEHDENYANVLGPYFVKDSSIKPNIVLIISESLSSSFSGKACGTPASFTPYIDSLARHGLSWNNFLANAERSHGVLTNLLASLPTGIGQRGFVNMRVTLPQGKSYPKHQSIYEPLGKNGYTSSFYYGGWGYYDRAGYFLAEHGIDYFATEDSFSKEEYQRKKGEMSWGYNDKDLFRMSENLYHNQKKKTPFIDVYQTLSLHTPYNLVTPKYESDDYIYERIKQLGIRPAEVHKIPINLMRSILFSEDAVKEYITSISTKKAYENTIFIITGDHGVDCPIGNKPLERYKVPLVIYSNLIVKRANFNGYCSHIDVVPSILALLQNNFGIKLSNEKHWMGAGLDTSRMFRNVKKIPLAVNNDNLAQYISGTFIKYNDRIVKFDSALYTTEVSDKFVIDSINREFENYRFMNEYVCRRDLIWQSE